MSQEARDIRDIIAPAAPTHPPPTLRRLYDVTSYAASLSSAPMPNSGIASRWSSIESVLIHQSHFCLNESGQHEKLIKETQQFNCQFSQN